MKTIKPPLLIPPEKNNDATWLYNTMIPLENKENLQRVKKEAILLRQKIEEASKITSTSSSGKLLERIQNRDAKWPTIYGNSYGEICEKISKDDIIATIFATDPTRQNLSERTHGWIMKNNRLLFEQIPSGSKKRRHELHQGNLYRGQKKQKKKYSSTCDFLISGFLMENTERNFRYPILTYNKITGGMAGFDGGQQILSKGEAEDWIREAVHYLGAERIPQYYLAAIVDGIKFDDKCIQELQALIPEKYRPLLFVGPMKSFIEIQIIKWMEEVLESCDSIC